MSSIKQLAGQTFWYGLSSMGARFLNYLLTPYLTGTMTTEGYGEMSIVYGAVPLLNVIFAYGLETAYFRFAKQGKEREVYNTTSLSIIFTTLIFTTLLISFREELATLALIPAHPDYITMMALIIGLDALAILPFTKLRQEGRPIKFATIRIASILINIGAVYFFISVLPELKEQYPNNTIFALYNKDHQVGYVIMANLLQAFFTLIFLSREWLSIKFQFNARLWKEIMVYALPLTIVGFGGMINETIDRLMLPWRLGIDVEAAKGETGIYNAVYKLSLLITLFVQAFRMGAEPFFFKQAEGENAQKTYARVMKFFVIAVTGMFLFVALYLEAWKHFIQNPEMWVGLKVVPILLFANIFLGIYYNLSIWYKISGRTRAGATITLVGAGITLLVNYFFIPYFSYMASAWATFLCYGTMMVISFTWGQKVYPVPYAWKKLLAYMVIVALLFFVHKGLTAVVANKVFYYALATLLLAAYGFFILRVERKEFKRFPVIGKYL
ncbi:lipopolysaccharide biosynthesis protein [Parasegetibacter sp. NRK P23]|uniref:lipopolysaccharide biosynthesis protein n=1 Tax=Parasegetibacter sp. NRK P23 TaxID=2942999 RepID=UPI0020439942|nr:oligosaccharide flippase family protein [Parasegetibacter sp. NRK P23]MCM5530174.1 oligosaccharide flippase family protein [Parasegetibacter sp. NRK P23]